jgi:hypothetical protein
MYKVLKQFPHPLRVFSIGEVIVDESEFLLSPINLEHLLREKYVECMTEVATKSTPPVTKDK